MKCNIQKEDIDFQCLLFDFDNTLVDFHESSHLAFDQTFRDYGLAQKKEHYQIYSKINAEIWSDFEQKKITANDIRKSRFTLFFKEVGIENIDGFEFNAKYLMNIIKFTTIRAEVVGMLERLHEKYKMCIITNGLKEVQRARIEKCGITHLFDSITVSDEIGVAKPDKKYFEIALEKLDAGISKSKILVIGDSLKSDIAGAQDYGLKSCYIGENDLASADIIIRDVTDLEAILKSIYVPVNCDWYDYLEIYSMRKNWVDLEFTDTVKIISVKTKIEDLYTKNKEEFAVITDGSHVRLDHIISIKLAT